MKREMIGESVMPRHGELGRFLEDHRATIIDEWTKSVRELPKARTLATPALVNHIPLLLDEIGKVADRLVAGGDEAFPEHDAVAHALQRLDLGFDLEEVTAEYSVLRRTVLGLLDATGIVLRVRELQFLNAAIDAAMSQAVSGYASAQQRIIQALDRISEATLTVTNVEELLSRLLQVFVETTAPVDTVTLMLREGDRLRVRAAVGIGLEWRGATVAIGEGFAGRIAKERRPLAIGDAATDPLVAHEPFRAAGIKALYGVPLLEHGDVVGVAWMGSRTASLFSHEQQVLFRAMASRATLLISHALTLARERAASIVARALARSGNLDEAGIRMLADIGEAFGWQTGAYWRVEAGLLKYREGWTAAGADLAAFHELSRGLEFEPGSGLPGRAWRSGGVEWIADVEKDAALPRKMAAVRSGLQSAIAFPLSTGEETLGVLEFFSRESRVAVDEAVEMTAVMTRHLPEFIHRIHAQERLRQSEAQKAAMLEVALDCVITMDADGRVVAWNPATERTFGYSEQEVVGQDLAALIIPPELRSDHRSGLARYLGTGRTHYLNRRLEVPALRRDGTRIVVELAITRVPVDGPPLFTGYLRDITGRKRAEEEQSRLYRQAEEASRMRERLLTIVAHDLRNPLGAVIGAAGLLFKRADPADTATRRPAEKILRASARMDRLIADLLDTANIHRGQLSIQRLPHRLADVLSDAREQHAGMAAAKDIQLTVEMDHPDLECVYDRDRILQVLSNLIGNAIKFGRSGDAIRVHASTRPDDVLIEVADTAPGISPDDLPLIFEPYWSGRLGAERPTESTGLGLFISKGIIEAHGGQLWAESEVGRGSTFRFTLPLLLEG
jgi:PAS domain S-box-containing protein